MKRYDYIIAGAGAAGLSLAMHLIDSARFRDKSVLIVDRSPKDVNDRTWCFWEISPGLFEPIVYKRWRSMWFHGVDGVSKCYNTDPYQYKMIRGIDYYDYCFDQISKQGNITIIYGDVSNLESTGDNASLEVDGQKIFATYIFSSIPVPVNLGETDYFLWQHFKGWVISTNENKFDPERATLMDFRIDQHNDCRFIYVMPFSTNKSLVEYTVFSEEKLSDDEYDTALARYCNDVLQLGTGQYEIQSAEFGMIPMTCYNFPKSRNNIIYIGTAGGQTKASSGYTFNFIHKHSKKIVHRLNESARPEVEVADKRFNFYDSVLLRILSQKTLKGADIFTTLFLKNEINQVFRFLDNETSVREDIGIIKTLPTIDFASAAIAHIAGKKIKKSSKL